MLSVVRVHLPTEIPIVGCEITPYVVLRRPDNTVSRDDVPESAPVEGQHMRYRWYRVENDNKILLCSVHPTQRATIQCLACIKAKIPVAKSYHCSPRCFSDAWHYHRELHDRANSAANQSGTEEELFGKLGSSGSGVNTGITSSASSFGQSTGPKSGHYPAAVAERSGGEVLFEVGRSKTYTPTADDIGHVLKFECIAVDAETKIPVRASSTILTSSVIPAPSPIPRRRIPVNDVQGPASSGMFTVLSYNILADLYAKIEAYSYCPSWALSWSYRRQNLLREIIGYNADIICLQEVQKEHLLEFFVPELDKHGYEALYKLKTSEGYNGNPIAVDGCATFYRRRMFSHVKKYEVDFNKTAQSMADSMFAANQKRAVLNRLIKDNVALIVVLEAKFSVHGLDIPGKQQLLCVANTHVDVPQDCKDVKIWQVLSLLKGLEEITAGADMPMLLCGDFDSTPNSGPHSLLSVGKLDVQHPDLATDLYGILHPIDKLHHKLKLVSAYSSFARTKGFGLQAAQRRRVDPVSNEPWFTKYTRDYIGTVDYIFYTVDSLAVESLLELLDEESLRRDTGLPSPELSSDHIALLAEFRCTPKTRPSWPYLR